MVAYNFQTRFADAVASGKKHQTIRAPRKDGRHALVGDRLQLYTGMRRKSCRKLVEPDPVCVSVYQIRISATALQLCGATLDLDCADPWRGEFPNLIARRDGFANFREMRDWFDETHGLPFDGFLITWLASKLDHATLLSERAGLIAENEAATNWGAAVGERSKRITAIERAIESDGGPVPQPVDATSPNPALSE